MTRLPFLVLTLALLLSLTHSAQAQDQAQDKVYSLSNYDVTLELRDDGSYDVRETIRLNPEQGTFRFFRRDVPLRRLDSLTNVTVSSPDVAVDSLEVRKDGGDVRMRWTYPPRDAPATFDIHYRAHGGLRILDDRNVLKWVAVGSGWDVPVRDVDVTLRIPASLDIARDALALTPDPVSVQRRAGTGWEVTFRRDALKSGRGYSVEATFPARIEAKKGLPPSTVLQSVVLALLVLIGAIVLRVSKRKSPVPAPTSASEPKMTLPEAARILSDSRSGRMHAAMLFDLANRGNLTLIPEVSTSWLGTDGEVRLDVHPDRFGLNEFERDFLDALQEQETMEDVAKNMSSFRKEQRTEIRKRLVQRGWLKDRQREHNRVTFWGLGVGLLAFGVAMLGIWLNAPAATYVVGALTGLFAGSLLFIGTQYPRTEEGRRKRAEVEAYVSSLREELDRLRENDPNAAARRFAEVLPWLLLDERVTAGWLKKMEDALEDTSVDVLMPSWLMRAEVSDADVVASTVLMYTVLSSNGATGGVASGGGGAGGAGVAGAGAGGAAGGGGGGAG